MKLPIQLSQDSLTCDSRLAMATDLQWLMSGVEEAHVPSAWHRFSFDTPTTQSGLGTICVVVEELQ